MKKVIIFGGTHGNEWTGIYLVQQYAEELKKEFPTLDLHFIHANPEAYKINKRFKDEDLNRAFQYLNEDRPGSYEHLRARDLKILIDSGPCFVIDLHTTTSNMGNTVIISHDRPLNFYVSQELTKSLSSTRVIVSPDPNKKYLASQSDLGLMIEVGPIANGIVGPKALESSLFILRGILKTLSNLPSTLSGALEVYEEIEDIYYPQDESGALTAYIHPDLQDRDFTPLKGNYSAFKSFKGETLSRIAKEELFPIFINEAAYYGVKLAFTLCRKKTLNY